MQLEHGAAAWPARDEAHDTRLRTTRPGVLSLADQDAPYHQLLSQLIAGRHPHLLPRFVGGGGSRHHREVRLIVPGSQDSVENVGRHARIYTPSAPRSPVFDSRYRLLLPHLYALPYESKLKKILKQERPDLVEVCDKYTLCFLPRILRNGWFQGETAPLVVGLSCERLDDNVLAFVSARDLGRRFANWYMTTVYGPRFDCHISNSDYTARELQQALTHRPDLGIYVCPMGVDGAGFNPQLRTEACRRELLGGFTAPATPNTLLLLYVGRISLEKNIPLLLDMVESLIRDPSADYRLVVVGSGPKAEWLVKVAHQRIPGRALLLGHVSDRERLANIYASSDALIHPNPREPFGIVPLEAMASGLPVVVPNSGGVLSYANLSNAWIAPPTGDAFAKAVGEIFAAENARESKIEQGLQTAAEFDWTHVTGRFFALYDKLHDRFSEINSERANPSLPRVGHPVANTPARQSPLVR